MTCEYEWYWQGKPETLGQKSVPLPLCPHWSNLRCSGSNPGLYDECLFAGLLPRRSGFDPRPAYIWFLVEKRAPGQGFLPSTLFFHCQCHFTSASFSCFIFMARLLNPRRRASVRHWPEGWLGCRNYVGSFEKRKYFTRPLMKCRFFGRLSHSLPLYQLSCPGFQVYLCHSCKCCKGCVG